MKRRVYQGVIVLVVPVFSVTPCYWSRYSTASKKRHDVVVLSVNYGFICRAMPKLS